MSRDLNVFACGVCVWASQNRHVDIQIIYLIDRFSQNYEIHMCNRNQFDSGVREVISVCVKVDRSLGKLKKTSTNETLITNICPCWNYQIEINLVAIATLSGKLASIKSMWLVEHQMLTFIANLKNKSWPKNRPEFEKRVLVSIRIQTISFESFLRKINFQLNAKTSTELDSCAWTCIAWTGIFQAHTDVHASIFSGVFFFKID